MKRLAIVLLNGCHSSSVGYLLDVVQMANQEIAVHADDGATIEYDVISLHGRPVQATDGFQIVPNLSVDSASTQYDLVFVPALDYPDSSIFFERLASAKPLYPWLQRQWQGGAVIASLCTGMFVLAEAGLLDGRLATTSWWLEKQFHRCYPAVKLDITRDLAEADGLVSGSTLGVGAQLSLNLIDRLTDSWLSERIAESVMFDVHGCSESRGVLESAGNGGELVAKVQGWFAKNLEKKIKMADAASFLKVSERTLIRHFKKNLGMTPRAYLQNMRIESAKHMLQDTNLRIGKVAERVGYCDIAFFQRVFRSHVGMSPTAFRSHRATSQSAHQSTH